MAKDVDDSTWPCGDCGADVEFALDWCPDCAEGRESSQGYQELADELASEKRVHDKVRKAHMLQQVGGAHYIKYKIQPWDIIDCYGLSFYEGSALKYLLRYRDKNGVEDLKKARHYIDALIAKAEDS